MHLGLPKVSFVRSFVVAGGALHFALPRGFRDARFVCLRGFPPGFLVRVFARGFAGWLFAASLYDKNYTRNLSRLRVRLLLSINCLEGGCLAPGFPQGSCSIWIGSRPSASARALLFTSRSVLRHRYGARGAAALRATVLPDFSCEQQLDTFQSSCQF